MMAELGELVRVNSVTCIEHFKVMLLFEDGVEKDLDLEPYLRGPIFEPIRDDINMFRTIKVEAGTIAWENGADIDLDVLYYNLKPAWLEEAESAER